MVHPSERSRIPVVNKRFQYKYTAIMVGVTMLVSAVLVALLLESYSEINKMLYLVFQTPGMNSQVDADQVLRVFKFSGIFFVLQIVAIGVTGLLITHRICGPVFVIERQLTNLLDGKYPPKRQLRAGDEFISTFETLNAVTESLKNRDVSEAEELTHTIAAAQRAGMADSDVAVLQRLVEERRARVRGEGNGPYPRALDAPVFQRSPSEAGQPAI